MSATKDQPARPWGMSRATENLPEASRPWVATRLDPETQLAIFYDENGATIDITSGEGSSRTYASVSMSRPHDGATNAPQHADDSPTDNETD
jgi:putative ATP-grasp target RiPP